MKTVNNTKNNEWGTVELTKKYRTATPGQERATFKDYSSTLKSPAEITKRLLRALGRMQSGEIERKTDPATAETP